MLKKQITYYTICVSEEYSSYDAEYFDTLQDAWDARYKYADWYCPKGRNTIVKYTTVNGAITDNERWTVDGDNWVKWPSKERGAGCPKE